MARIISDTYFKKDKKVWNLDMDNPKNQEFNRKIVAVNDMYGWLYKKGVLRDVSFEFKDYSDMAFFALDVKDLEPYRSEMEQCGIKYGIKDAALAVHHIFEEEYTPCRYSGAIQLGWTMSTYRDVDGCVGRSWETGLVQGLGNNDIADLPYIAAEKGTQEAIKVLFERCDFEPDLFDKACEYYRTLCDIDSFGIEDHDFLLKHVDELIYCYENTKDLIDFDFWVQYEALLGEKLTWDEYIAIDRQFDGDPHDIEENDIDAISGLRNSLKEYRDSIVITQEEMDEFVNRGETRLKQEAKEDMRSLADQIKLAEICLSDNQSVKEFIFTPMDYEAAKAALLASKDDSMYWKNDGYACKLERGKDNDVYYDLHLVGAGTAVMYGERVELVRESSERVDIRVPNDYERVVSVNKEFFKKNFSPCPVPERGKTKENIKQER